MAYPRENLAPGERIVLHRHPHWKCLLGPFLIFILVTVVVGVLAGVVTGNDLGSTPTMVLLIILGVLWLAGFGWYFVRPLVSWKSTHFVLTDRRVIFRNGIITRSGIDIPIRRINTVEFRHGLIDRMLRTGTLVIESASDDPLSFDDIPQVEKVHALLYHEVLDMQDDEDGGARADTGTVDR
ncbi:MULTISPECIES: PH domain-containing protein [unclassified Gordonia (in: high G+C Gram-positive bacteria)]|uniref:PH domain-containing protein n=1 Tax=unclassified Gordonia (in: high G+C Gram-positive bacteria) TaxID=2657482 RepID=UPI001F0E9A16|nr:PH domain-containing protein [Gordonia sp. ABSL49_1]MCH5643641.1 PH domain-containing protein [Gordonia sp. ABSL49_1]